MTTTTITYAELAKRLNAMKLFNKAPYLDEELYDKIENGNLYDCECEKDNCDVWDEKHEKNEKDIFQWYLITPSDAEYLKSVTNELIFYSDVLDEYVWGITHFGTPWDSVEVNINENN